MPDSQPQEPAQPDRDAPPPPGPPGGPYGTAPGAAPEGAPPPASLVLCGARLADGRTVDVRIGGGRIEAVGTAGSLSSPAPPWATRIDLDGYLLLPAPAEPHAHYDTALTADGDAHGAPGASGASPYGPWDPYDPGRVQRRAAEAALLQLGHGATAVRTHVRVGDVAGLRALRAVLRARRALHGLTDLTAVAVPRLLTGAAGADGLAMLREAVGMGATAVGGCPDLDPDPAGYTEAVLEVAAEHGCAVDLHTDGSDPVRLSRLASVAGGLRPRVAVGPCDGLARLPRETAARAAEALAAAGITVVCLPQGGCGLPPRADCGPRTAPVRLLRAAGVRVAAGSGALRDTANPVGRGDPLEAAYLLASHGQAGPEEAYEAVSARAREAMGLPRVRIEAGFPAELLAVRGRTLAGTLSLAYSRLVVHRGRVVARTSAVREYCDATDPGGPADTAAPEPGGPAAELGLPRQSQR
ncbi:N-isopropylammelide isopropyl amidohydrolase [Streptomyces sp. enrichment culture]|uniref:hydrolase n=1 Tax=Streptomyces sp. enrichment culture TaxID=1795815 RepID=UPI003F5472DC